MRISSVLLRLALVVRVAMATAGYFFKIQMFMISVSVSSG